jgi:hypothetical protein
MDILENTVIIREELHAPEVDEYDEIDRKKISGTPEIGQYIEYVL